MLKILVIGNSFGTDATRYLYGIARAQGVKMKVVNLYIGGCSLFRHYRNMLSEVKDYAYEINGMSSGLYVSLKEGLLSDEWDCVIMQQCSPKSDDPESYEPYLSKLAEYVRECQPHAKLYLNETWTFARESTRFALTKSETPEEMFPKVKKNYRDAAIRISAYGLIPSGSAMYAYYREVEPLGGTIYRDTFHADLGVGRYLLGCVWFEALTGRSAVGNTFNDFDKVVTAEERERAERIAHEVFELED